MIAIKRIDEIMTQIYVCEKCRNKREIKDNKPLLNPCPALQEIMGRRLSRGDIEENGIIRKRKKNE